MGISAYRLSRKKSGQFSAGHIWNGQSISSVTEQAKSLEVESFGESRCTLEVTVNGPLAISDCVHE
jgi:hypothetical protein